MSDVIEVMVDMYESMSGTSEYRMSMALRGAEAHGWRLVPVEPTPVMESELSYSFQSEPRFPGAAYSAAIQAAPRPWSEDD